MKKTVEANPGTQSSLRTKSEYNILASLYRYVSEIDFYVLKG